jgi:hypothetical protein
MSETKQVNTLRDSYIKDMVEFGYPNNEDTKTVAMRFASVWVGWSLIIACGCDIDGLDYYSPPGYQKWVERWFSDSGGIVRRIKDSLGMDTEVGDDVKVVSSPDV